MFCYETETLGLQLIWNAAMWCWLLGQVSHRKICLISYNLRKKVNSPPWVLFSFLELTEHSSNAFLLLRVQNGVTVFALLGNMDSIHQKNIRENVLNSYRELLFNSRPCKIDLSVWLRLLHMPSFQLFNDEAIYSACNFLYQIYMLYMYIHIFVCVCAIWMDCCKIHAVFQESRVVFVEKYWLLHRFILELSLGLKWFGLVFFLKKGWVCWGIKWQTHNFGS